MITIFENFENKKSYWLVPTDDRLIKSLKEITQKLWYRDRKECGFW